MCFYMTKCKIWKHILSLNQYVNCVQCSAKSDTGFYGRLAANWFNTYTDGQKKRIRIELCQVRRGSQHELHELTMTRTLSKATHQDYLNLSNFVYQACWLIYMNILTAVTNFISCFFFCFPLLRKTIEIRQCYTMRHSLNRLILISF